MKSMMCIDYKYSRACPGPGKGTAAALRGKVQRMLPRPLLFQVMMVMIIMVMSEGVISAHWTAPNQLNVFKIPSSRFSPARLLFLWLSSNPAKGGKPIIEDVTRAPKCITYKLQKLEEKMRSFQGSNNHKHQKE